MRNLTEGVYIDSPIIHYTLNPSIPVGEVSEIKTYLINALSLQEPYLDDNTTPSVLTLVNYNTLTLTVQLNLDWAPLYLVETITQLLGDYGFIHIIPN